MSYNITNPLYPRPASLTSGTGYITSHVFSVTAGAATDTAFNVTPPGAVDLVAFDVQGAEVRTFWEGSTPTSSSGHILPVSTGYTWSAVQYNAAKFILSGTATSATIVASAFTAG